MCLYGKASVCYFLSSSAKNHPPIANNFLKFFFASFAILTLNAATAWAEDYSIKFLTNTNDGSTEITSSTRTSTVLESASCSNVSGFTNNCTKAYYKGKSGVKLSSGSASGTLELTLSDVCNKNVSKVVFKTAKYNSESSTLTFYAGTSTLGTVAAGNEFSYTFTEPQSISTLKISSTKRAYVSEITISVNSAVTPESGTGKAATYTVSSATAVTATGNIPQGSTATLSGTGSLNGGFIQCTNGKNHILTLTGYEGYKITGVTIHVKSNSSKGTGSFSVVAGSKTIANVVESAFNSTNWNGSWNNSGVDKVLTMTDNSYEIKTGENVKLTINCKSGSSDYNSLYIKSYTITYEPVSSTSEPENPTANYTIKHYLQNILDDNYTLKDTKTLSGEVGTEVTPSVESYEGFTAPSTQTVTIASDGSTVVEYKYTRNSYKLTWDLDGGTITTVGTTAGSVKYGATIIAPIVTKDGCQFKNWNPSVPATMPADDATYTAQWSKLYTVTLSENGTTTEPTTQTSTTYKLPAELTAGSCKDDTKELVGWSTVAIPNPGDMPTSKFYELGETVTLSEDKTTFYAVFATPTTIPGGTEEKEVVTALDFSNQGYENGEEVTSLTIDDVTVAFNKGTNSNVPKYYNTGAAVRVYGGGYFTVTVPNESSISTIALTFGSGDESNTITTNSNTYSNGTWTGSAQSVKFTVGGTTGHRRIKSVKVTYTTTVQADDIVTYSKYSTTCEAVTDIELQSIKISGDLTKKTYTVGDDLDFGGLTVTAKYSNATSKNVTNEVEWSDVTLTVGQTSVTLTATYEGKTDDITITGLTVSSPATPEPEGEWVLTQLADITCSDLVVITMKNSNGTYALTNGNGTSDAPKATKVEIANDKLKTEPSEILQWVVMNNNGDLTIYPVNDYNRWLYCINNNNGVRVGDNEDNKLFTIDADYGYMYNVGQERYLGVYNSQDWRCYTTMHDNIKGQTLCFYVKKDANPNPCEKPVDDGINPVATFIFNTAEGLDDLGIDYPNTPAGSGAYKNDMSNDESYTQEGITFTNVQNGSTVTRVWCSSAGNLDLRIYQNATVKFSVPDNMYIRKIIFNGDALSSISPDKGNLKSKIWTGREREILFSVADGANVVKIYTISFALEYTRTVTPDNQWGTICLPYASASTTGATFYEVSSLVVGEGLWLDQLANGAQLVAGKPYIFYATDSEITVTYTGDAKAAPVAGENGLRGTFTDIAEGGVQGHYIIAKNQIWVANDKNTLPAYRAYINAGVVPTTAQAQLPGRRRVCMGENTTTDFENITNGENNTIKVIENGQLFIIRNGEKYNIQGQKL